MNKKLQILKYILSDYITGAFAWFLFFYFRKTYIEHPYHVEFTQIINNERFWKGAILVPLAWVILNAILGLYNNVFRKSRLKETGVTFLSSLIGCLVIFFALVLDDVNYSYT